MEKKTDNGFLVAFKVDPLAAVPSCYLWSETLCNLCSLFIFKGL